MTEELHSTVPQSGHKDPVYRALYGDGTVNGEPGLIAMVRDILSRLDDLEGDKDKQLSMQQGFGLAVAGGFITQTFGFVLHIIKEITK